MPILEIPFNPDTRSSSPSPSRTPASGSSSFEAFLLPPLRSLTPHDDLFVVAIIQCRFCSLGP